MTIWGKLAGLTAFLGAVATLYTVLFPSTAAKNGSTETIYNNTATGCGSITVQINKNQKSQASLRQKVVESREKLAQNKAKRAEVRGHPRAEQPSQEEAQQEAELQNLDKQITNLNDEIQKLRTQLQSCKG